MVRFEVVRGRKGEGDKLVKVWANGEVLSFRDVLFLLKHYFESEDSYYPISQGFQGRCMLLKAILEVYSGIPLEKVVKDYQLDRKRKSILYIHEVIE